jgi:hypothetical protein
VRKRERERERGVGGEGARTSKKHLKKNMKSAFSPVFLKFKKNEKPTVSIRIRAYLP